MDQKLKEFAAQSSIELALTPWFEALKNPQGAQKRLLQRLVSGYSRTEYGDEHQARNIGSVEDYRRDFPVVTYDDMQPHIEKAKRGGGCALLSEPILAFAMTRGTTGKESKYIPVTAPDIEERSKFGPRGVLNYIYRSGRHEILGGYCLNQTFPSEVGHFQVGDRRLPYGYNSGVYARYATQQARLQMVPTQDEIDALGGELKREDWYRRFELIYECGKDKQVTMVIGVAQTMLEFGRYCKRRFGAYPGDIWHICVLAATAMPGIHTKYKGALRALYGDAEIVEMYAATEGIFAQQLDEKPYVVPNYDGIFLEVETRRGVLMLHEMNRGERGSLIISTPLLPRYRMGDVVICYGHPYFRCPGRERDFHPVRFALESFFTSDWQSLGLLLRW